MDRRQFIIGSAAIMGAKVPAFSAALEPPAGAWIIRAKDPTGKVVAWAEVSYHKITGPCEIYFADVTWENNSGQAWIIDRFTLSMPTEYGGLEADLPLRSPLPGPIFDGDTLTVQEITCSITPE